MTEQAEAGDVGCGVHRVAHRQRSVARARVQCRHDANRLVDERGGRLVTFHRRGDHPQANRLRQHDHVPGARGPVREHTLRVDGADHRETELRFRVIDGVAATHDRARAPDDLVTAVEHARQQVEGKALARPRHEVEREERRPAHRVDVGERVRRCDPTPVVGVVDDRREEVGGDDDGEVVAQAVDGGVVSGVEAHQQVGVAGRVEPADQSEDRPQVGR